MGAGFWAALFGAIGVVAGVTSAHLLGRRKARADADTQLGAAVASIAQEADKQLERMGAWLTDANQRAIAFQRQADEARVDLVTVRARVRELEHRVSLLQAQVDHERDVSQQRIARLTAVISHDRDLFRAELGRLRVTLDQRGRAAVDDLLHQLVGADLNGRGDVE